VAPEIVPQISPRQYKNAVKITTEKKDTHPLGMQIKNQGHPYPGFHSCRATIEGIEIKDREKIRSCMRREGPGADFL
jgi:hypothetical protein